MKAWFIKEISVIDPDTQNEVYIGIYKLENGAVAGFDSSYMEQVEEGPWNPYEETKEEIVEQSI